MGKGYQPQKDIRCGVGDESKANTRHFLAVPFPKLKEHISNQKNESVHNNSCLQETPFEFTSPTSIKGAIV